MEVSRARGEAKALYDSFDLVMILTLIAMVAAAFTLAAARRLRTLGTIAMVTWSLLIPIVVYETARQLLERPFPLLPAWQIRFLPRLGIMPGISGPSRFSTNRLGMRGSEWEEDSYRILAVGGSTTLDTYLSDEETWSAVVMQALNANSPKERYWVGNVGKLGHDTFDHIELLDRLPEAGKVDSWLLLVGANDFARALRASVELRQRLAPSRAFDLGGPMDPTQPWFKQTYIYRSIKALVRARSSWLRSRSSSSEGSLRTEDTEGMVYEARRRRRRKAPKDYPLPVLDSRIDVYGKQLHRIAARCKDQAVRCIFMTQPTMWAEDMPEELEKWLWDPPIGGAAISTADLARGMAAFNQQLLEVCDNESLECLDLASALPKDTSVFYDDCHFNEAGARAVGRLVAEKILSERESSSRTG